eukprot:scaffold50992_cov16-Tisochrysis_lutea.AAC.1
MQEDHHYFNMARLKPQKQDTRKETALTEDALKAQEVRTGSNPLRAAAPDLFTQPHTDLCHACRCTQRLFYRSTRAQEPPKPKVLSSILDFSTGPVSERVKWHSGNSMLEDMMYAVRPIKGMQGME